MAAWDRFIAAFAPAQLPRSANANMPVPAGFGVRSMLILRCVVMAETKYLKIGLLKKFNESNYWEELCTTTFEPSTAI